MIKLQPITTEQTISILPRVYSTSVTMSLRDDSTNTSVSITPSAVLSGNYVNLTAIFDLKEGRFYDLKVIEISSTDIVYKDKIFCTAQSTDQSNNEYYSVNKDTYIENGGNNDFIIL
jgi:hypothetical protein|tara:strand:+ start:519 stop:869 length:351 start_codon:yes stop_codon:yes gene_type:complete